MTENENERHAINLFLHSLTLLRTDDDGPHGPQTKPSAVMSSPRPRRYAPRSQAMSP
jgi:hypothetical protein